MDYEKMSLAELRAEAKKVRNELYKPVSRSKKSDLVAELSRHRGMSSSSTGSESTIAPEPEKAKPKKADKPVKEKKEEKPKAEKPKVKKAHAEKKAEEKKEEVLSLKRKLKNSEETPKPAKKAKKSE